MFKLTESKRDVWFNPSCTWQGDEYQLVGVLVGLAVYNATLLDLHFPLVCYKKLLELPVGMNVMWLCMCVFSLYFLAAGLNLPSDCCTCNMSVSL